jgi:electron transfer flavoprotein beta subunit
VEEISKIDPTARIIRVRRRLEKQCEIVEANLPALITVVREINTPRYPTVPGRLNAADAALPVWSNNVLKLEPEKIGLRGSPTQVKKIFAPVRAKGEVIPGEGEHKEAALASMLQKLADWDIVRWPQGRSGEGPGSAEACAAMGSDPMSDGGRGEA